MITGASIFHIEAVAASQKLYLFLYSDSQLYALEGCRRCGADDALIKGWCICKFRRDQVR
jgi:hypothetical protein